MLLRVRDASTVRIEMMRKRWINTIDLERLDKKECI